MTADPAERPEWWIENEELREFLGLPEYNPPRFEDGTFTHDVVPALEDELACNVQFIGVNTAYLEDWEVRIDGETAFPIGHRRDESGNTVYEIDSGTFAERIRQFVSDAGSG